MLQAIGVVVGGSSIRLPGVGRITACGLPIGSELPFFRREAWVNNAVHLCWTRGGCRDCIGPCWHLRMRKLDPVTYVHGWFRDIKAFEQGPGGLS